MAKRVMLIVDDDPANLDFLERVFREEFDVLRADDGRAAVELIEQHPLDVIITDQKMPGMTGTQVLEASLDIRPHAVKIILSAYTDTADILSAINVCRINHYLQKPVTAAKLRDVVQRALELVPQAARYE